MTEKDSSPLNEIIQDQLELVFLAINYIQLLASGKVLPDKDFEFLKKSPKEFFRHLQTLP